MLHGSLTTGSAARRCIPPLHPHTQYPMSQDDTDERATLPTDAAPPPSERRSTLPPGPADAAAERALRTLLPPRNAPLALQPDWWEGSFFQGIFNQLQAGVARLGETKDGYDAILKAIDDSHTENQANWSAMRGQLETWRKASEVRDDRQDERIAELERQLTAAKSEMLAAIEIAVREAVAPYAIKIEELESNVEELKNRVPRAPTPSAA